MKIAVLGAGAMGSLYGGYLSMAGCEVYLVDIWKEHIDKINNEGLKITRDSSQLFAHPRGTINSNEVGIVDLVIVFVKSTMTRKAMDENKSLLGANTFVLSLQNGYGNIEEIEKYVDKKKIIAGTTAHGATMLSPGSIKHAGTGETHIGPVSGDFNDNLIKIAELLKLAGFETTVSKNVMELIWSKLIVNVGINALTGILGVKNGDLLKANEIKTIMNMAIKEAVKVADKSGIKFDEDEMIKKVYSIAEKTGENKSSLLQDILNKRKTEIDMINGAIVREGLKNSIETPVNLTLLNLISVIEKGYLKK